MIRLFTAIALPEDLRTRLGALAHGIPGARWVAPQNIHLTLRFIGEVPEPQLADIAESLAQVCVRSFELVLSGVGRFGNDRRGGALWVGVERSEALQRLYAKIDRALVRTGLDPEGRKYTAHITLARLKSPDRRRLGEFLAANSLFRHGPIPVDSFVLFSSAMGRGGSHYVVERVFPLDGKDVSDAAGAAGA